MLNSAGSPEHVLPPWKRTDVSKSTSRSRKRNWRSKKRWSDSRKKKKIKALGTTSSIFTNPTRSLPGLTFRSRSATLNTSAKRLWTRRARPRSFTESSRTSWESKRGSSWTSRDRMRFRPVSMLLNQEKPSKFWTKQADWLGLLKKSRLVGRPSSSLRDLRKAWIPRWRLWLITLWTLNSVRTICTVRAAVSMTKMKTWTVLRWDSSLTISGLKTWNCLARRQISLRESKQRTKRLTMTVSATLLISVKKTSSRRPCKSWLPKNKKSWLQTTESGGKVRLERFPGTTVSMISQGRRKQMSITLDLSSRWSLEPRANLKSTPRRRFPRINSRPVTCLFKQTQRRRMISISW